MDVINFLRAMQQDPQRLSDEIEKMEHSDRENAKRAIEEVHKKYNAAASSSNEGMRQPQPLTAASTVEDNSKDADNLSLLGRAVGTRPDEDSDVDEENANSKTSNSSR